MKTPPNLKFTIEPSKEHLTANRREFLQLSLILTNNCDLACSGCYVPKGLEELTEDEIRILLKEAKNSGASSLRLTGGDVFLHRFFYNNSADAFPLIDEANRQGLGVIVLTDGSKLSDESCRILSKKEVSFVVKFWGTPELQERLTGNKDKFRANYSEYNGLLIPSGLKQLLDAGFNSDKDSRIGIQTMLIPENADFSVRVYRWARENNIIPYVELKLAANPRQYFSVEEIRELFIRFRKIDNFFGFDWEPITPQVGNWCSCQRMYYGLVVHPNGDITSCSALPALGNIRKRDNLESIWESREHAYFLSKAEKVPGCRCHAYLRTGDAFARYDFIIS